jgi:hypothetical protein
MKKFICGFAADRIESTEHFYTIYTEEQLTEYKKFFNETCKDISEDEYFEVEPGFDDAEISLYWIRHELDNAVEMTPEVEKAMCMLRSILPSQEDILSSIKQYIEDEGYLED